MTDPFDVRNGPPANRTGLSGTLASPEGTLLLLRAFLGVTFTFAGLQKLANPNFFSPIAPGSFQEQLRGSIITSPFISSSTPPSMRPWSSPSWSPWGRSLSASARW